MYKNSGFFKSVKNAMTGIAEAFLNEINMRIHFAVANLIFIFAYFYGISREQWAILVIMTGLVFFAELMNTSIENAVDTATKKRCETARVAKDIAAGAVLIIAFISVVVGFLIFYNPEKIVATLTYIFTTPKVLIPSLLIGIIDILIVLFAKRTKTDSFEKDVD